MRSGRSDHVELNGPSLALELTLAVSRPDIRDSPSTPEMKSRGLALLILLVASIAGLAPPGTTIYAQHRSGLSADLLKFKGSQSLGSTRVIVPGDPGSAAALTARHHLRVVRR